MTAAACFIVAAVQSLHYTVDPRSWKTSGVNEEVKRHLVEALELHEDLSACA